MAFRTLIIDSHSKLEYSLEYLIFRTPSETKRVLLDEIHTLIIQSTTVSLTTSLVAELSKRKIKVIFCDEKKNPACELTPYYNAHNTSGRVLEQIEWTDSIKDHIWKIIIQEKIRNQSKSLKRKGKNEQSELLMQYVLEVESGDSTNREGHAAKVYFNSIYHSGFTRDEDCDINKFLNYGYTILLSQFNRSIVSAGYITQIGIHHKNEYNQFNLSCDLMEPFRFIIDEYVDTLTGNDNWKDELVNLLGSEFMIDGKMQTLANAINIYCLSVFNSLRTGKVGEIKFIEHDL